MISSTYFTKINIHNSFSNFINCQQKSSNISISSSSFHNFLRSSILVENMAIVKQEFSKGLPNIYDTSISCRDCIFTSCQDKHKGSAISSLSILILINCLFRHCKSEIGGAIFAQDRSDFTSCSFEKCYAFDDAGSAYISNGPRFRIQHSDFTHSKSPKTAALYIEAKKSHASYVNISLCKTRGYHGMLYYKNTEATNANIIFCSDESEADCAGCFTYKNKLITFLSSIFAQILTDGKNFEYGAAITSRDMQNDTMIYHSSFMSIMHSRGFVIATIIPNDFHVFIYQTCFSDLHSVFQSNIIYDNETTIINGNCGSFLPFYIAKRIGFLTPQFKQRAFIKRLTANWLFVVLKSIVPIVYVLAFAFVILTYFLFLRIPNKRKKSKKRIIV